MGIAGFRLVIEPRTPENTLLIFVGVNEEIHETMAQCSQFPSGVGLNCHLNASELIMSPQSYAPGPWALIKRHAMKTYGGIKAYFHHS
jgi:hypothetical protein